ncbi:MAG: phosphoglucosamine mutase [Phycisphaerae bacterium]|nr:phosphoglucosamine mutase [Phycisphaerae bacterium]
MSSPNTDAPLMLSVSGARGIVGKTMTPAVAAEFAAAFAALVAEGTKGRRPRLVVGRDGRQGGACLALAVQGGLAAVGCDVIDLGVTMTPTVGVMIRELKADGGMAVTASHNPIEWNGLKCLDGDGLAPPKPVADEIVARFKSKRIAYTSSLDVGTIETNTSSNETHIAKVLAYVDVERIRAARFHVVLDSVNASGCVPGRALLERLGCRVTHLFGEPTGIFGHVPEPIEQNLVALASGVRTTAGASCGFAQDPDADRLAIVDERGRFIGEEYTLVLAALRVLARRGPTAPKATLATNLSTSRMIDDVAARFGATVLRTAVGEANVVAALKPAKGLLGGEGNGGVIVPEICWVRDSLSAMAIVLELLATEERPLSEIVDSLPRYAMVKTKLDLAGIGGLAAVGPALERTKSAFASERINATDGVRIDFADGWVHLRASNTEPIVRIIAEAPTKARADELIARCAKAAGLAG